MQKRQSYNASAIEPAFVCANEIVLSALGGMTFVKLLNALTSDNSSFLNKFNIIDSCSDHLARLSKS